MRPRAGLVLGGRRRAGWAAPSQQVFWERKGDRMCSRGPGAGRGARQRAAAVGTGRSPAAVVGEERQAGRRREGMQLKKEEAAAAVTSGISSYETAAGRVEGVLRHCLFSHL